MKRIFMITILLVASLSLTGCLDSSVESYLKSHYRYIGEQKNKSGGKSKVYLSKQSVRKTAEAIHKGRKSADRKISASGVFLRYSKHIVAVVPRVGGSKIYLDNQRSGYHHWYPYLGGWWGTYSGPSDRYYSPGGGFRGGGPGSGK